eukprot:11181674-Lingulodinium_polyedra.AAC.1
MLSKSVRPANHTMRWDTWALGGLPIAALQQGTFTTRLSRAKKRALSSTAGYLCGTGHIHIQISK